MAAAVAPAANNRKKSSAEWLIPVATVATVFVMLVPVPAIIIDIFLALSITMGVVVLLSALYILKPVDFSVFPTLLLFLTLFRISLNIASSRFTAPKAPPPQAASFRPLGNSLWAATMSLAS